MSARDDILSALRGSGRTPRPLPDIMRFPAAETAGAEEFTRALTAMGGRIAGALPPAEALRQAYPDAVRIASAAPEIASDRPIRIDTDPHTLEDVDVAVFRTPFGIAETGSVFVDEKVLRCNALAFYAQHLFVLLDPRAIIDTVHDACARPEFGNARYAALVTGPSATADIEGVLVHGAQGPRSLTVCFCKDGSSSPLLHRSEHGSRLSPG